MNGDDNEMFDRDALLHVVRAARIADRVAEDLKGILVDRKDATWVDEIAAELNDALFKISGEQLEPEQDFLKDSRTMRMIRGAMTDADVTNEFLKMIESKEETYIATPPKPISRDEFRDMVRRYGGYLYEPKKREESKWKGMMKQLHSTRKENEKLHNLLIRAANELCIKCSFRSDPMLNGNCDNCQWQKVRYGGIPDDAE